MAYGAILGQKTIIPENPNTIATNVSYNNSTTSSIIKGTDVQSAIDQLFTSVSNGKELVANAITDKGVATSANDTFATMANNIESLNIIQPMKYPGQNLGSERKTSTSNGRDNYLFTIPNDCNYMTISWYAPGMSSIQIVYIYTKYQTFTFNDNVNGSGGLIKFIPYTHSINREPDITINNNILTLSVIANRSGDYNSIIANYLKY